MYNSFFFRKSVVYGIIWKNIAALDRPQMTIWRMLISRWVTKATDAHSRNMEYFLLFCCSNGCTNASQSYVIHTLPALFLLRLTAFLLYGTRRPLDNSIQECPTCLAKRHIRYCGL